MYEIPNTLLYNSFNPKIKYFETNIISIVKYSIQQYFNSMFSRILQFLLRWPTLMILILFQQLLIRYQLWIWNLNIELYVYFQLFYRTNFLHIQYITNVLIKSLMVNNICICTSTLCLDQKVDFIFLVFKKIVCFTLTLEAIICSNRL